MRQFLTYNITWPINDLLKGNHSRDYFKFLQSFSGMPYEQVKVYQLQRVKVLIDHAYHTSSFYRTQFNQAKIRPEHIQSLNDLKLLPTLERDALQCQYDKIISSKFDKNKLKQGSSSGSTGTPIIYYKDKNSTGRGIGAMYFGWSISGHKVGNKGLHIWGNPSTVNTVWNTPQSKIKASLFNHYKFPAYKLTDKGKFDELANLLIREKFSFIDGYTNTIYLLAMHLLDTGTKITPLKQVFTTAENLLPHQKTAIESALGPVYDMYGCSEINGIANQFDRSGNYLVLDPHVIVEFDDKVLDENGNKALIITDLDNFSFPFIRYRNGDVGAPSDDTSGFSGYHFSKIKQIGGRVSDIIEIPSGGMLSVPSFFGSSLLQQLQGLRQYQIEKIKDDLIRINLVVDENFGRDSKSIIDEALKTYLEGKINYEIAFVSSIPTSANGKFKLLIDHTKKT